MFIQNGSDMDMQPVKKKRHIFDVWGNGDIIFIIFYLTISDRMPLL